MSRSLQGELLLATAIAVLLTGALVAILLPGLIRSHFREAEERSQRAQAQLAKQLLEPHLGNTTRLKRETAAAATALSARVIVQGEEGQLLAESGPPAHPSLVLSVPITDGVRPIAFVRVSRASDRGARAVGSVMGVLYLVLSAGAALALLFALRIGRGVGQPLTEISTLARKMAAGELQQRAPVADTRELAELGRAFNSMATRVRDIVAQLWQERNKLVTILKQMTDGMVLTDNDGRITLLNPAAQRNLELNADAVLGKSLLEATLNYPLHALLHEALESHREMAGEVRLTLDAGRVLQLQAYAAPVESDTGEAEGGMLVLHDLTELRRLEEVRRQFVANASHELRTPLTAIKMMTETLLAGAKEAPESRDRFLHVIERETNRLVALVDDLLDLSRIESGATQIHLEPVRLKGLVEGVRDEMLPRAEERGQSLRVEADAALAAMAEPAALRQVLLNLVDNGIKYTPAGGEVAIRAWQNDGHALIAVQDTGIGIPHTETQRIFERFYRVDKARSRQEGGTGLGLAIVKHLVEALHGSIRVESVLNRGSTFTVALPIAESGDR
jgi:two-component system phosphate regulon sensor histidine kinase PhoR